MALNDIIDQEDICASSTLTWYACFLLEEQGRKVSQVQKSHWQWGFGLREKKIYDDAA